jgi:putative ABC transport system substrate-binding protein
MRRREFVAGTAATAAIGLTNRTHAQTDSRLPSKKRIAIFHPFEPPEGLSVNGRRAFKAFFGEPNKLGCIEGQNLIVERYSALGQPDRIGDLAREIVASHPDLIIALGGTIARILKPLTTTIPILATTADPVAGGIVTNLAKPGGNITGISVFAGLEIAGKRLQFLRETVGKLTNVCVLFPTSVVPFWEMTKATFLETAAGAGIPISTAVVTGKLDRDAYERAFDEMRAGKVDGVLVGDASENVTNRHVIVELAATHSLPAIYPYSEFVEVGGLMSYGVDLSDVDRRLADMTDEVLRGAKPADIPYRQQTKFELVLNRKTAASLGLEFPPTLLTAADEVIE